MKIISTSKVQKNISILSDNTNIYTVVKNGDPKTMIIPYYEGLQKVIEDYLENIEMYSNKENLQKQGIESLKSGLSNLTV